MAIKRNEALTYATTLVNFAKIMPNKRSKKVSHRKIFCDV